MQFGKYSIALHGWPGITIGLTVFTPQPGLHHHEIIIHLILFAIVIEWEN